MNHFLKKEDPKTLPLRAAAKYHHRQYIALLRQSGMGMEEKPNTEDTYFHVACVSGAGVARLCKTSRQKYRA